MSFLKRLFGRPSAAPPVPQLTVSLDESLVTDSGFFVLWDQASFAHVTDRATWESEFGEESDLVRNVSAGKLVPIVFGMGGFKVFKVLVSSGTGTTVLTDREKLYLKQSRPPFRFIATGKAFISGIESVYIDAEPDTSFVLNLEAGTYSVVAHIIDWEREPGARGASGFRVETALPDVVVLVSPAEQG